MISFGYITIILTVTIINNLIDLLHELIAQMLTQLQALWYLLNKSLYYLIHKTAHYFKLFALHITKTIISPICSGLHWVFSLIITSITYCLWHTYAYVIFPIFTSILWCFNKGYQCLVFLHNITQKVFCQPLLTILQKISSKLVSLCIFFFTIIKYHVLIPLQNTFLWLYRQLLIGLYSLAHTLHIGIFTPLYRVKSWRWRHTLQRLYQITGLINNWVISPTIQWLTWGLAKLARGSIKVLIFFIDWIGNPALQVTRWVWEKCFFIFSIIADALHNIIILPLSLACKWTLNFSAHLVHSWLIRPLIKMVFWIAETSVLLTKFINTWIISPLSKIALYSWGRIIYTVSASWSLLHTWLVNPIISNLQALIQVMTIANLFYTAQTLLAVAIHPAIGLYLALSKTSTLPIFLTISILVCALSAPYFLKKPNNLYRIFGWIYFSFSVATLCTLSLHNTTPLNAKNLFDTTKKYPQNPLKQDRAIQKSYYAEHKPAAIWMFRFIPLVFSYPTT